MRSELVFAARHKLWNRYALCQAAAKATRRFHKARNRIPDTTNDVLQRIAESDREPVTLGSEHDLADRRLFRLSTRRRSNDAKISAAYDFLPSGTSLALIANEAS